MISEHFVFECFWSTISQAPAKFTGREEISSCLEFWWVAATPFGVLDTLFFASGLNGAWSTWVVVDAWFTPAWYTKKASIFQVVFFSLDLQTSTIIPHQEVCQFKTDYWRKDTRVSWYGKPAQASYLETVSPCMLPVKSTIIIGGLKVQVTPMQLHGGFLLPLQNLIFPPGFYGRVRHWKKPTQTMWYYVCRKSLKNYLRFVFYVANHSKITI